MSEKAKYNEFTEDGVIKHTEDIDFWWCRDETFTGFAVAMPKKFNPKMEHEILISWDAMLRELLNKVK